MRDGSTNGKTGNGSHGHERLIPGPEDWDHYELTDELEAFLREAGTPEEIAEREKKLLHQFREVFKTLPPDALTDEERFFVDETMTILGKHLLKLRAQAEWAVAMLMYEGWRFDRRKNRLQRLQGTGGLRQRRFTDDVLSLYRETGGGNTRAVRVHISQGLDGVYPGEMLSPRAYFPIWHALQGNLRSGSFADDL